MKAKIILTIITSIIFFNSFGQKLIETTKVDLKKLLVEIKYDGKIRTAISWQDNEGKHILLTTETGEYLEKKFEHQDDGKDAALYAYHFLIKVEKYSLIWKMYDFIKDCPFDINMDYIPNTCKVTDLNNDGIAEVWLIYKKACRSDVSPVEMKIIMYQAQQKFAMRGHNKTRISATEFIGGDYKFDEAFAKGPNEFRAFAQKLWKENLLEKFSRP